jgi:hypothetical protein
MRAISGVHVRAGGRKSIPRKYPNTAIPLFAVRCNARRQIRMGGIEGPVRYDGRRVPAKVFVQDEPKRIQTP